MRECGKLFCLHLAICLALGLMAECLGLGAVGGAVQARTPQAAKQREQITQPPLTNQVAVQLGVTNSFGELEARAKQGDVAAQTQLGIKYGKGEGVPRDPVAGAAWFLKAGEKGDAQAQNALGLCYVKGEGVAQDFAQAVKWFRNAAEQGYPKAQNNLGLCYVKGQGVPQDYAEAVKWFRKAAEQDVAAAQANLGVRYAKGQGVLQDDAEALKWFRKAAEQGHAGGQSNLGMSYAKGAGVPQDFTEAVKWFRKAAEQGDSQAQYNLVRCYTEGKGVSKDLTEAQKWLTKAEQNGEKEGKENLAGTNEGQNGRDSAEARAAQGDSDAQFNMGIRYRYGLGVAEDFVEAYKWFLLAAWQFHPKAVRYCDWIKLTMTPQMAAQAQSRAAAFSLKRPLNKNDITEIATLDGKTYKSVRVLKVKPEGLEVEFKPDGGGIGAATIRFTNLPRSLQEHYRAEAEEATAKARRQAENALAVKAYEVEKLRRIPEYAPAEQGDPEAQFKMGVRYWSGVGVPQDATKGLEWWEKAAEQGHPNAQNNVGFAYYQGKQIKQDLNLAAKWCRRAAAQGCVKAQCNLSVMCATGQGAPKDPVEAYKWISLAAAQGDPELARVRDKLAAAMSPAMILEGQRRASAFVQRMEMAKGPGEKRVPQPKPTEKHGATGTGFFVTDDGYLITCAHVIEKSNSLRARTAKGTASANLIKEDRVIDVALLKVSGAFDAIPVFSDASGLKLGDEVFTIGFPNPDVQGVKPKLTRGEISSLAGIRDDPRYLQISVPVQPGNSGGALVDERGNAVGVVTARLDDAATWEISGALPQNVNYAVKSELVYNFLKKVPQLNGKLKPSRTTRDRGAADAATERAAVLVLAE